MGIAMQYLHVPHSKHFIVSNNGFQGLEIPTFYNNISNEEVIFYQAIFTL